MQIPSPRAGAQNGVKWRLDFKLTFHLAQFVASQRCRAQRLVLTVLLGDRLTKLLGSRDYAKIAIVYSLYLNGVLNRIGGCFAQGNVGINI